MIKKFIAANLSVLAMASAAVTVDPSEWFAYSEPAPGFLVLISKNVCRDKAMNSKGWRLGFISARFNADLNTGSGCWANTKTKNTITYCYLKPGDVLNMEDCREYGKAFFYDTNDLPKEPRRAF